jgi:tRNA modification GTPase
VSQLSAIDAGTLQRMAAEGHVYLVTWRGALNERVLVYSHRADFLEIHCHGGMIPSQKILADLADIGIATVPWKQLTPREARTQIELEALDDLAHATTLRTASILLDQFHGALPNSMAALRRLADGNYREQVAGELARIADRFELGRHLVSPWRVAIVGRPNVGKSSLLNALVGYNRAIVHSSAGTTRDLVAAETAFEGWPIQLLDTAGIRSAHDIVETAGVELSRAALQQSNRQLVVWDVTQPITDEDYAIWRACSHPILVANKSDQPAAWTPTEEIPAIRASATAGTGVEVILERLAQSLVPDPPPPGAAVPFRPWQVDLVAKLLESTRREPEVNITELLASGERLMCQVID